MSMSKIIWINFYAFFLLFLVSSCNNQAYFDKTKDIGNSWKAQEKVSFVVEITDSIKAFDFYINIRNTVDYRYSNVFVFLKTNFPDGRYSIDTINIWLADPQGNWLGKGFGKYRDNSVLFKHDGRFPMKGKYRFEFEQAMREESLVGLSALGIRIEDSRIKE